MKWRHAVLATILAFLVPFPITWIYTFTEVSVGPVVFLYSLLVGVALSLIFSSLLTSRFHLVAGLIVLFPLGYAIFCGILNIFIWATVIMGEMDYDVM
jgi:hypothetical protein